MKVLVGVDVIEGLSGRTEGVELRLDLGLELAAHARQAKYPECGGGHVVAKHARRIDEIGNGGCGQCWPAIDQNDMQPDAQARQGLRARDGACCGLAGNHQASRGYETIASSRVRRNWKNSTPSRRRRRIISGEVSISPTMAAIFEGRK